MGFWVAGTDGFYDLLKLLMLLRKARSASLVMNIKEKSKCIYYLPTTSKRTKQKYKVISKTQEKYYNSQEPSGKKKERDQEAKR